MLFWIINSVLLPAVATDIARLIHPPPTGLEFDSLIRAQTKALAASAATRRQALEARLLKQYGVARVEDLPVNFAGEAALEAEATQDQLQNQIFDDLYGVYERQQRIYERLAVVAPLLSLQSLSMGLSGSDFAHHRHFANAAERYRQQMLRILNQSSASAAPEALREYADTGILVSRAGQEVWQRVPPFTYTPPSVWMVVTAHRRDIATLLVWAAIAATLMPLAVARARVS
jgi:ABC-2 type transport system permease protein